MRMISLEEATLDNCVNEAQHERVIITRNGKPVALIVGVEGMDEEQLLLGSSDKFWQFINERRKQYTITRAKLEQTINDKSASRVGPKNRRIE